MYPFHPFISQFQVSEVDIVSSGILDGVVPERSPKAEPGNESYIGSRNTPLIVKSMFSSGEYTKSNSYQSAD